MGQVCNVFKFGQCYSCDHPCPEYFENHGWIEDDQIEASEPSEWEELQGDIDDFGPQYFRPTLHDPVEG